MGKSAVKAAYDTAAAHLVEPREDEHGFRQPPYVRGGRAAQMSKRLKWHQSCVANLMAGKTYGNRGKVKEALEESAKACATKNPYPKA